MIFKKNDLRRTLLAKVGYSSGIYDGMGWTILPGNDTEDESLKLISRHEEAHSRLNNRTTLGCILLGYANLHGLNATTDNRYIKKLEYLLERSENAHEIYATWDGLSWYKKNFDDDSPVTKFYLVEPYLLYYKIARNFVCELKSCYLQNICIEALIFWCFQSRAIGQALLNDFEAQWLATVRSGEFPDARLEFLKKNIKANYLYGLMKQFIECRQESAAYQFLIAEFNDDHTSPIPEEIELEIAASDFYCLLSDELDKISGKSSTYRSEDHLAVANAFFSKITEKYPKDKYLHRVLLNQAPNNIYWARLIQVEAESLLITNHPLKARIYFPENLPDQCMNAITKTAAQEGLLLHSRHTATLLSQYDFSKSDLEYLDDCYGALIFLRGIIKDRSEIIIFFIPFLSPQEIYQFTQKWQLSSTTHPYISIGAFWDDKFDSIWTNNLFDVEGAAFILNDTSLLYCIEYVLKGNTTIKIELLSVLVNNRNQLSIVLTAHVDNTKWIIITPGSSFFIDEMLTYISYNHSEYSKVAILSESEKIIVQLILKSIYTQEHKWFLRTQFVIDTLMEIGAKM